MRRGAAGPRHSAGRPGPACAYQDNGGRADVGIAHGECPRVWGPTSANLGFAFGGMWLVGLLERRLWAMSEWPTIRSEPVQTLRDEC